jgi:hypothetical protein
MLCAAADAVEEALQRYEAAKARKVEAMAQARACGKSDAFIGQFVRLSDRRVGVILNAGEAESTTGQDD